MNIFLYVLVLICCYNNIVWADAWNDYERQSIKEDTQFRERERYDSNARWSAESSGASNYQTKDGSVFETNAGYNRRMDSGSSNSDSIPYSKWSSYSNTQSSPELGKRSSVYGNYNNTANFAPSTAELNKIQAKADYDLALIIIDKYKSKYDSNKYNADIVIYKSNIITLLKAKVSINDPLMRDTIYKLNKATKDKANYRRNFYMTLMSNDEYKTALKIISINS